MTQKQRSLLGLLAMLVAAGGLGGAAYWSNRRDTQKHDAEEKAAALFSFKPDEVTALTLTAKGQTASLTKASGVWRLGQPVDAPADAEAVSSVLARMAGLRRKSLVEEHAANLAKFGLDKPTVRLNATYPGGSAELSLGAVNDYAGGQYAQLGGSDAVLLLEGMQDAALSRSPFELRDKRLVVVDPAKVQRIEVEAAPDRYTLVRQGETWKVTSPSEELADAHIVESVLDVALNLRATAIADEKGEAPAKFGLDKPVARMTAVLDDGKRVEVSFGQAQVENEKREYAQASTGPVVAQVPVDAHAKLHQSLASLEDKTVAKVDASRVAAVQIEGGGEKILAQHKPGNADAGAPDAWTLLSPKSGPAKRWKMNALVHELGNLQGTAVVGRAPDDVGKYGLDNPQRTVTVQDGSGKSLLELKLGREENGGIYATSGDGRILSVERSRVTELLSKADDLLDTPPAASAAK